MQSVAEVDPDLVTGNEKGEAEAVRYEAVNAMLLNEFLKEHKKVQQLDAAVAQQRDQFEATIAELKKEMERVAAHSKEQDAKIQKAGARFRPNGATSQTVANK